MLLNCIGEAKQILDGHAAVSLYGDKQFEGGVFCCRDAVHKDAVAVPLVVRCIAAGDGQITEHGDELRIERIVLRHSLKLALIRDKLVFRQIHGPLIGGNGLCAGLVQIPSHKPVTGLFRWR